ncbi:MAG: MaoC/PaaZ C-terminal domain-containing protein [Candidatus Methanomethylicia archaeon]
MRFYEDFNIGDFFETPRRTITEADIVNFAGISGDFNPLHIDEVFAKQTIFGRRVAHGLLTLAVTSGLWMRLGFFEGSVIAFYGIDNLRFVKPVFAGDTIMARIKVIEKIEKGNYGIVTFSNEVYNQREELVLTFQAKLLLKKKQL